MPTKSLIAPGNRIPTLDGWRCVAIIAVLLSHLQYVFLGGEYHGYAWLNFSQHGVQLFFVLSGYLITSQLLAEGRIHLGRFYVRRFFRLMPAAWLYLGFLGLLTAYTPMKVLGQDVWPCLFFYRNYVLETAANTCTEHFWSLSLEEQFYLVWPPLLVLLGRRNAGLLAVVSVMAISLYRLYCWGQLSQGLTFQHTEVRADAILVGCLLAYLLQREQVRTWFARNGVWVCLTCLPVLVWDVYAYHSLIPLHETLLISCVLAATSLSPGMFISRLLDLQHVRFTGVLSYGIYVWQGVFLRPAWGIWGPMLLGIAFLGSWVLVEQPLSKVGRWLVARMALQTARAE